MGSVLSRVRNPEYTREDCCVPCTAVNVVIAVEVAVAVGYIGTTAVGSFVGAAAGVLTGTLCVAVISFSHCDVPDPSQTAGQ